MLKRHGSHGDHLIFTDDSSSVACNYTQNVFSSQKYMVNTAKLKGIITALLTCPLLTPAGHILPISGVTGFEATLRPPQSFPSSGAGSDYALLKTEA